MTTLPDRLDRELASKQGTAAVAGVAVIPAGQAVGQIVVPVIGDQVLENPFGQSETFQVRLREILFKPAPESLKVTAFQSPGKEKRKRCQCSSLSL